MKKLLAVALILFMSYGLMAQNMAQGIVYLDANRNGQKDKKEQGIANVAVSNGVDVVLTNKEGKYNLEVGKDNIIFIIKPSGYKADVDEYNNPRYYYKHKPGGSPSLYYEGV